jgi:hypothetical protein
MENKDDLTGRFARLPDGQKVRIESVEGKWATVRRVGGAKHRSLAVCTLDRLRIDRL